MSARYICDLNGVASFGGQVPVIVEIASQFEEGNANRRAAYSGGITCGGYGNQGGIVGGNGALIPRVPPNEVENRYLIIYSTSAQEKAPRRVRLIQSKVDDN